MLRRVFPHLPDHADDRQRSPDRPWDPESVALREEYRQALAENVGPAPESLRQALGNDCDAQAIACVARREVAAGEKRNTDRFEIPRGDDPAQRARFAARHIGATLHGDRKRGADRR